MRLPRVAFFGFFVLSIISVGSLGAGPQPVGAGPSVLLITLDTTRADKLGVYGNKNGITPSLDALAQRCWVFDRCETSVPQTMPSHATILSGWYPYHHTVRKNMETLVPEAVPLIAEEFRNKGYATGAFVSAWVLEGRYGFARGFDIYDDSFTKKTFKKEAERRADKTLKAADDWLRKQSGRWFCWVHLFDPHEPYAPPEPYATQFKGHLYDGEIAFMDDALGSLFGVLLARGQLENTIVVVCGDHGESLGEHGEQTHGLFLYEATTRVPLLIHLPGQIIQHRIADPVGLVDISPTLRELCGLESPLADGVSLAPLLLGQQWKPSAIYMESMDSLLAYGWAPLYGRVENNYKYILAPREELYNLSSDQAEQANLAKREVGEATQMREALQHIVGQKPEVKSQSLQLDKEEMQALMSLGYIAGTPGLKGASYADPKDKIEEYIALQESRRLVNEKKANEAAVLLERLYDGGTRSVQVLFGLCLCYFETAPQKSLRFALEAIRARPDFAQPYERAILILLAQGKYTDAKNLADLGIRETGDWDGAISIQGAWAAYMLNKSDSEVLPYLKKISGPWSEHYMSAKLKALLALRRQDRPEALKWLSVMAKSAPPEAMKALSREEKFKPLQGDPKFREILGGAAGETKTASTSP
jgi:arylsulfatase A-like enzyme